MTRCGGHRAGGFGLAAGAAALIAILIAVVLLAPAGAALPSVSPLLTQGGGVISPVSDLAIGEAR